MAWDATRRTAKSSSVKEPRESIDYSSFKQNDFVDDGKSDLRRSMIS